MKNIFSIVGSVLGWIAIVGVFACVGLFTDNPGLMVPLYGVLTILVLVIFVLIARRQKSKAYDELKTPAWVPGLYCGLLSVFSITFPHLSISFLRPSEFNSFSIYFVTILTIAVGFGGVWMINVMALKNKIFAVVGFLVLILLSLVPALLVAPIDPSYGTLGVIYFTMTFEAVIVWNAITLWNKHFFKDLKIKKSES